MTDAESQRVVSEGVWKNFEEIDPAQLPLIPDPQRETNIEPVDGTLNGTADEGIGES
jgi:hypothetical protein